MRKAIAILLALFALLVITPILNAEPVLLYQASSSGKPLLILENNDVLYWYQDDMEFIAQVEDNTINLYYQGQRFLSYSDYNDIYVTTTAYDHRGEIVSRSRSKAGSRAYLIAGILLKHAARK